MGELDTSNLACEPIQISDDLEETTVLPASPISPQNHEQWTSATKATLDEVGSLTRELLKQVHGQQRRAASASGFRASPKFASRYQNRSAQLRLGTGLPPRSVVTASSATQMEMMSKIGLCRERLKSLATAIQQLQGELQRVEASMRKKWAALKLCEWRLEMRSKRPPQELFRDNLQLALERERETLVGARQTLADHAVKLKQSDKDLAASQFRVFREQDRLGRDGMLEQAPLSPQDAESGEASTAQLCQQAAEVVEVARRLTRAAARAVPEVDKNCDQANAQVAVGFKRKHAETLDLKSKIQVQLHETQNAISVAERSAFSYQTRLDNGEDMSHLGEDMKTTTAMLDKLRESKRALEEEQRCKLATMKIDESCRRIPPHMVPAHGKPRSTDFGKLVLNMSASSPMSASTPTLGIRPSTAPANASKLC